MISLERRDGRPLRIGHRGAAALAPENTLRAFRAAVEAGVDLVEFDVLDLGGGELVVAHSYDLREVSHGALTGTIQGRTLDGVRVDCPELPSLDEALAFFVEEAPDVGLHLDVKSASAVPETSFGVSARSTAAVAFSSLPMRISLAFARTRPLRTSRRRSSATSAETSAR